MYVPANSKYHQRQPARYKVRTYIPDHGWYTAAYVLLSDARKVYKRFMQVAPCATRMWSV